MTEIRNYDTAGLVAKAAAENAVEILNEAIQSNGRAYWVLAGGSSPMAAYKELIKTYAADVDWSKVTILMGDERYVPFDDKDSNWGAIITLFNASPELSKVKRVSPDIFATVEATALAYDVAVKALHIDRFDLVWIGVGEDGHTLSLFPGSTGLTEATESWVVPVTHAPKPPSERISLSLKACEHIAELVIFATGANKKDILRTARLKGGLPISVVAEVAEFSGGEVRWLYDDAAWGER